MYSVAVRRTKIIATVGPSSSDAATVAALIASGVNVFRLNFSHGTHQSHGAVLEIIRAAAKADGREVAILQDLSGPKIRTGMLEGHEPLMLTPGEPLEIQIGNAVGRPGLVTTTYAPLADALKPADRLLLDDGRIELVVESVSPAMISTRVVHGGILGEHKGINAPNVALPSIGVTAKDEADLRYGLAAGIDLVALSFVQTPADILRARAIAVEEGRPHVPIIAKLERPEAIRRLPEIIDAADAVMVARGDLGLEMPLEQVPQVQKQVLHLARDRGVPVIVATQVLESMRTETRPTRAEVSDAAGAVDAGADAIMLSGETAVGAHPARAVEVLDTIIRNAEAVPPPWALPTPVRERPDHLPPLCDAAVTLAARAGADAILAITHEGRTARLLAARRPTAPIFAATDSVEVSRSLCLWWGVVSIVDRLTGDGDAVAMRVVDRLRPAGEIPSPARVVVVSASPDLEKSGANVLRIRQLD
jgi:pyruvate kinase